LEGEVSRHQHEEDDAAEPNVDLGAVVAPAGEHLGRDVGRGAAEGKEEPVVAHLVGHGGEAEVGDLKVAVVVHEEVLGLEVAVEDAGGVAEGDGGDELLEVSAGGVLEHAAFGDAREELTAAQVLHDEVDPYPGGHDLVELNDVGVADAAEDGDLALDVGEESVPEDLLLVEGLDGDQLASAGVAGDVVLGEATGTKE
ncbi:unnamed protein product, partial [Musa hybrid cultivar]